MPASGLGFLEGTLAIGDSDASCTLRSSARPLLNCDRWSRTLDCPQDEAHNTPEEVSVKSSRFYGGAMQRSRGGVGRAMQRTEGGRFSVDKSGSHPACPQRGHSDGRRVPLPVEMSVRGTGERDGWRMSPPGASLSLASAYTAQTWRRACRNVFLKSLDRP
jgi:hypothetical protein